MSSLELTEIDALIDELVDAGEWSMPVRSMQNLIAAGETALVPLSELVQDVAGDEYDLASVWAAIVLGQQRAAAAAPVLAEAIAKSSPKALLFRVAAADALAHIGEPALPALRRLVASDERADRLWAYYAAGLMHHAAAFDFLLDALASDAALPDVIALALADYGNPAAIAALLQALARAEPGQRSDIEDAIRDLHQGTRPQHTRRRDWRIRYRTNAMFGRFPLSWATFLAILQHRPEFTARDGPPARTLAEILAVRKPVSEKLCDCCGVPTWSGTGVPVCARTAATIPVLQADMLKLRREADLTDDVFELLDIIDADLIEAGMEADGPTHRARERQEDHLTSLRLTQAALVWAVERGADSISGARAMLLAEATQAAHEHGDPHGIFQRVQPRAPSAPARAGRNDPCPCGSGRKYKKCCGPRDAAAPAPTPVTSSASAPRLPTLFTFDHEPFGP